MTNSDSTPDFSWLKNNSEDPDSDQNSTDSPPSDESPQPSLEEERSEEVETESAQAQSDEQGAVTVSESTQENTGAGDGMEQDLESAEPEAEEVNPAAETWVPETTGFQSEVSTTSAASDSVLNDDDAPPSDSVFDDDSEEQEDELQSNVEPTDIMPGRQLSEEESEQLNSANDPEDLTVVLPVTDEGEQPSTVATAETFAQPELPVADENGESTGIGAAEGIDEQDEEAQESNGQTNEENSSVTSEEPAPDGSEDSNRTGTSETEAGTSNLKTVLLISYASAMTLIALFLFMKGNQPTTNPHLESLPDVAPEPMGELSYVPVEAQLPEGHTLKIGEKQRYGNILVEPIRVVREPIQFSHYDPTSRLTRPASDPVIKMWLRFTNLSDEQKIAPLDGDLLLRWVTNSAQQREYSNQYLFAEGASQSSDEISTYRHSKTSDWDLLDQQLGHVLEPGESFETYIASTEELPTELPQRLNWRFQFRKGYSPSGNGVTTLVDIAFNKDEIEATSHEG